MKVIAKATCLDDIVNSVADQTGLVRKEVKAIANCIFLEIKSNVMRGERVRIKNLGTITTKKSNGKKQAHNPKKPEDKYEIPPHMKLKFIPEGDIILAVRKLPLSN